VVSGDAGEASHKASGLGKKCKFALCEASAPGGDIRGGTGFLSQYPAEMQFRIEGPRWRGDGLV